MNMRRTKLEIIKQIFNFQHPYQQCEKGRTLTRVHACTCVYMSVPIKVKIHAT